MTLGLGRDTKTTAMGQRVPSFDDTHIKGVGGELQDAGLRDGTDDVTVGGCGGCDSLMGEQNTLGSTSAAGCEYYHCKILRVYFNSIQDVNLRRDHVRNGVWHNQYGGQLAMESVSLRR